MDSAAVRILLIDDDEFSFHVTRGMLGSVQGESYDLQWVNTDEAGLEELRLARHDVCLLDYQLRDRDGLKVLSQAVAEGCRVPIIMLTGESNQQVDREAMNFGATDFLEKGTLNATRLERSIRYAIERRHSLVLSEHRTAELNRSQQNCGRLRKRPSWPIARRVNSWRT